MYRQHSKSVVFLKMGRKAMKKLIKGVAHKARIAKSAAILTARAMNPVRRAKFLATAAKGEGFVLPGSKYIGPGNRMDKGKPVDQADANAYQHDIDYDNYLKKGHKARDVYTGWSDADDRLLKKTKADTPNGLAVNLGMGAKKLLHKTGLTKRIRDTDTPTPAKKKSVTPPMDPRNKIPGKNNAYNKVGYKITRDQPRVAAQGNPSAAGVQVRETRPM